MIRCYLAEAPSPERPDGLTASLPAWRRDILDRLRHESARRLSAGAGLLWQYAMRENGFDPDAPVCFLAAGKPVTDGVFFSLSHSGGMCLCALSDSPVGADIQESRPVKLSVARRFCPEEQAYLLALPEPEQTPALIRLWTRKEAWVKAVSADRMLALDECCVLSGGEGLCFSDFTHSGDYFISVCGSETVSELIEVRL